MYLHKLSLQLISECPFLNGQCRVHPSHVDGARRRCAKGWEWGEEGLNMLLAHSHTECEGLELSLHCDPDNKKSSSH
jgi:hypothetical protein